jgi:hypothetical protein
MRAAPPAIRPQAGAMLRAADTILAMPVAERSFG